MAEVLNDLVLRISSDVAELQKGIKGTQKQLTGFQKQVSNIGPMIAGAFAAGAIASFAKELGMAALEMDRLGRTVERFSNLSGKALNAATGQVKALADTYGESTDNILKSANALAKGMGLSFQDALDLIEKGFLTGANVSGELLDIIKEYPTFMNQAGYSAKEFLAIIQTQSKLGIFSDKGVDTIKEATLRINEMTRATKDAIEGIGFSSREIQRGIEDGSLSMEDAIQKIARRITELGPNSQAAATAVADILGAAGEDAGREWVKALGIGFKDFDTIVAEEVDQVNAKLLQSTKDLQTQFADIADDTGTVWKTTGALGNRILTELLRGINAIGSALKTDIGYIETLYRKYSSLFPDSARGGISLTDGTGLEGPAAIPTRPIPPGQQVTSDPIVEVTKLSKAVKDYIKLANEAVDVNITWFDDTFLLLENGKVALRDTNYLLEDQLDLERKLLAIRRLRTEELVPGAIASTARPEAGEQQGIDQTTADLMKLNEGIQAAQRYREEMQLLAETMQGQVVDGIVAVGATITSLMNTISNIDWEENMLAGLASIAAAIAQLIPQILALTAAKAVSGAASAPWPLNIAAMASALATVLSIGATIKAMTSKKAVGGLASGFTMVGEQGPELVQLGQPGRVYTASQTQNMLGGNGGNVRFVIEGDNLVGVLDKTNTKNNVFG